MACGAVHLNGQLVYVDFSGSSWDWWGEPATEPDGLPIPGWFRA